MSPLYPVTDFVTRLALRWRRFLLVAVLVLLYVVLLLGVNNPLAKTLFVAHLGLFMLWQPFVRADQRVALPLSGLLLAIVGAAAFGLNGWLLTLWIGLLGGVVGGKVFLFEVPWTRLFFLAGALLAGGGDVAAGLAGGDAGGHRHRLDGARHRPVGFAAGLCPDAARCRSSAKPTARSKPSISSIA